MKIAIVGGHMAPALGFMNALPKDASVIYIGREHVFEGDAGTSLEREAMRERGIQFVALQAGRMQRMLTKRTLTSLLKVPRGLFEAFTILKKEKPDAVVAFGGYLSVPIGIAARTLGIPLIIHESTLEAGLSNKLLIPFAIKICISWESNRAFFPKSKTILTGNPLLPFDEKVPKDLLPVSRDDVPLVVIVGGSGGSHAVNMIVSAILPELLAFTKVVHQCGDAKEFGDYDKLLKEKKKLPKKLQERYCVTKFVVPEVINSLFTLSDVVIGRSGINTVATLLLLKKKCILIPLPIGQKNEQLNNAKLLESEGLGLILEQKSLSPKTLFQEIQKILTEKKQENPKWEIPIEKNGAENLVREVLSCIPQHHREK